MSTGSVKLQFQFGTQTAPLDALAVDTIIARAMRDGSQYGSDQTITVVDNQPAKDWVQFDDLPYGEGYTWTAAAYANGSPVQAVASGPFAMGQKMQVIVVGGSVTPA